MSKVRKIPSTQRLRACFYYHKKTGLLFWEHNGELASKAKTGPKMLWLDGEMWLEHRIIWKLVTGQEPPVVLDHKNRNRRDNRWSNLRPSDHSSNQINRTVCWSAHGAKGIKITRNGKWEARIQKGKQYIHLGTFTSKRSALAARYKAERNLYGEFAP